MTDNPAIPTTPAMPVTPTTPTIPLTSTVRGPLKYSVETPAPQLEAGRKISVNLLINNPYDVPVKIISANAVLPAHFEDAEKKPHGFIEGLWEIGKKEAMEEISRSDKLQVISSRSVAKQPKVRSAPAGSEMNLSNGSGSTSSEKSSAMDSSDNDLDDQMVLQPGNTIVRAFTLRTKQTLLFTPSVHNMNAQICYQIADGKPNFDTVRYQLNIRAQFKSLIIGSLVGSVVGTALRFSKPLPEGWEFSALIPFLTALATGMLVGAVLVIAFARKKDAQPFITVEDFWGGFFVGFVAGYVGTSLIDGLVPKIGGA